MKSAILPKATLNADENTTFTVVATFSDTLETVFASVTSIYRDETGNYWITQEGGDLTEIPSDKYLYVQISKVFKE